MSLLLDALKEAEARKRDAASPAPQAPSAPPATTATMPVSVGALALAEDDPPARVAPAAAERRTPAPDVTAPTASMASAATATPPGAPAVPRHAAADALIAARAARGAPPRPAAPALAAVAEPTATPARAGAEASASRPAPAQVAPRGALPWLVGVALALGALVAGLALYDGVANEAVPAPAAAFVPAPAGALQPPTVAPSGDDVTRAVPRGAASDARPEPSSGVASAAPAPARAAAAKAGAAPDVPRATASAGTPRAAAGPAGAADPVRIAISRTPAPLEAAWAALQAGDLAGAEALYRQALAAEPGQVDAQLGLAVLAQSRGDDEAARRGFRRVLESVPDHPRAWAGLAELAGEGDAGAIESRLRQLLADRPSAPLHFALGNVLSRQQRWADAQAEYFAAASLEPLAPDYAFNVAVALERLGKGGAALPWYERALELAGRGRAVRFDAAAVRARLLQLRAASP